MNQVKRFYVSFLGGPTPTQHLLIASVLNLALSTIFYWISTTYFKVDILAYLLISTIVLSTFCLLYYYSMKDKYKLLSFLFILIQITVLLLLIDLMFLLMFLSGVSDRIDLSFNNQSLMLFIIVIGLWWVISLLYYFNVYRKQMPLFTMNKGIMRVVYVVCILMLVIGTLLGKGEMVFGLFFALLCTHVFSALIMDVYYEVMRISQTQKGDRS